MAMTSDDHPQDEKDQKRIRDAEYDDRKRQKRLEANRRSAAASRQRRLDLIGSLQQTVAGMSVTIANLERENIDLRRHLDYRRMSQAHGMMMGQPPPPQGQQQGPPPSHQPSHQPSPQGHLGGHGMQPGPPPHGRDPHAPPQGGMVPAGEGPPGGHGDTN